MQFFPGNVRPKGRKLPASLERSFAEVVVQKQRGQGQRQSQVGNQKILGDLRMEFSLKEAMERDYCPVVRFKADEWR